MNADTHQAQNKASQIRALKRASFNFSKSSLNYTHQQIQQALESLALYFDSYVSDVEANESMVSKFKPARMHFNHKESIFWGSLLKKQDHNAEFEQRFDMSLKEAQLGYNAKYANASLRLGIADIALNVKTECGLFKDEKFDPHADIKLEAQGSLASARLNARVGTQNIYATARATGSVGAVYAKAHVVLNSEEQSLEASVGAAALKGECEIAFNLFGARVTLTGQGSIGSAEATISYHHKNREWEFGSKLGFIAGLGFKINVRY